jgi:putative peptidoglycan lipid II flippase
MDRYAQVGLAFATAVGAWVNFALLIWFAARKNLIAIDARLRQSAGKLALAGVALAIALLIGERIAAALFGGWTTLRDEATLALLAIIGAVVYFGIVLALFGRQWLAALRRRSGSPPSPTVPAIGD